MKTRRVRVGNVPIGGGTSVSVQSMTNTNTTDISATREQIRRLENVGCDIVRIAVPSHDSVKTFGEIKKQVSIPLVADIHFDYTLALAAMDAGADKIRINPGNIGKSAHLRAIVEKAVGCKIPIRIGVNSGSIEKSILLAEGGPTVSALVASALKHATLLQDMGATDLVLSLKSSDVINTVNAYRKISKQSDLPLHLGVTEAGTRRTGTIKSSVALGILLAEGIGDTLRVSLTGDPVEEVNVGLQILRSLRLRSRGINLISCPTCGRTQVDMVPIAEQVEQRLSHLTAPLTVAVMGCEVNGPGEAREADVGVACGRQSALLFKKGEVVRKIKEQDIVEQLVEEAEAMAELWERQ